MVEVMNEVMKVSVDLYISKIYEDEPQFNEYINANAAERVKMRSQSISNYRFLTLNLYEDLLIYISKKRYEM